MATIFDIESQISALEKQIVQLKIRRNALVPILRLPVELLVHIFKDLQQDGNKPDPDCTLKTIALSSTCHQLRETALRAPDIWATLNCRNERWAELCALRAGSTPLCLFVEADKLGYIGDDEDSNPDDYSDDYNLEGVTSEAITTVSRHFKRAQSISLSIPVYNDKKFKKATGKLYESLKEPSQTLHSLKLHFSFYNPLPTPLLGGNCSTLTSLDIGFCVVPELPHLPSLSTLACESCQLVYNTISRDLCLMPHLKSLTLKTNHLVRSGRTEPATDTGHTLLPSLAHLDVYDTNLVLYSFLSMLPIPQQSLSIRTKGSRSAHDPQSQDRIQGITDYVHRFWEGCSTAHGSPLIHLRAFLSRTSWKWSLTFNFSGNAGQDGQEAYLRKATFGNDSFQYFHSILPRVQKATIYAIHIEEELNNIDFPNEDGGPFLVDLKEVEFCEPSYDFEIECLLLWLQDRRKIGYPIERVVFVNGYAPLQRSPHAHAIAAQVNEVVWIVTSAVNTK